jgi:hypothetical protein
MSSFPPGQFVREFSRRTYKNLQDIMDRHPVSFEDTALIASLLAVFVLPHERADDPTFLAGLLEEYRQFPLEKIVKVLRVVPQSKTPSGEESVPKSIGEIPKFLRHAVAHMNIKPESENGDSLTHLLVWNRHPHSKKITFVARVDIAKLHHLALHLLAQLSTRKVSDKYDGIDPIATFDRDHPEQVGEV